jgi:hypothetical protein
MKSTVQNRSKNYSLLEPYFVNLTRRTMVKKLHFLLPLMTVGMAAACLLLGVTATQAQTVVSITSGDPGGGFAPLSTIVGGVDFGSSTVTIQGVTFTAGSDTAENGIGNGTFGVPQAFGFGSTPNDNGMATMLSASTYAYSGGTQYGAPITSGDQYDEYQFTGLPLGQTYQVDIFTVCDANPRPTLTQVVGSTTLSYDVQTGLTPQDVIYDVTPDANGDITVEWTFGSGPYSVGTSGNSGCVSGIALTSQPSGPPMVPVIITEPVSQVVRQGSAVSLSVSVDSGPQTPYYQWYLGANPVAGATNSALVFASVSGTNAGSYTVVITNLSGSVTSAPPAILTVDTTTTTSLFVGGDIGQGLDLQGANFEVAEYYAPQDNGPLAIQNVTFTNNANRFTSASVFGSGVIAPDFGSDENDTNLSLIANNYAESDSTYDPLTFSLPTVSGESYKLQLIFHDTYNTAPGRQQLSVTIGSETVEPALDVAGQGGGGANPQGVVISYYFTGDGNPLPVTITNSLITGFAELNALTLESLPGSPQVPYFSLTPQNQTGVQQGAKATFSALAGGSIPPFSYQWYFGGAIINGASNTVLSLSDVQSTNAGQYSVVASNSAGSVTNSATLTVNNNVSIGISTGPAPGQGLILQGNFVLAEHFGNSSANLPISGVDFVYTSAGTITNDNAGNLPNFGSNPDELNYALLTYNSVWGAGSVDIPTTSGINYRLQLILHDNYYSTVNSRIFDIDAISDSGSGATNVLASGLDLASFGANEENPTNVVVTFYFTGDGNPLEIQMAATKDNPILSAFTLEDLTDVVAPTMAVPLSTLTAYTGSSVQDVAHVNGSLPLTYQWAKEIGGTYVNISGATNYILSLTNLGTTDFTNYEVIAANAEGSVTNTGAVQNVEGTNSVMIGHWLSGAQSFADTSGYMPAGTHDGVPTGANYYWTNDVPPNKGGYSLYFPANNPDTVILITNTWDTLSVDPGYEPTFDDVTNAFSVALWAKGFPSTWNPWMSKYGEGSDGWQLRRDGGNTYSCFTVRGAETAGDLGASTNTDDGNWHFYVGTYDAQQGLQSIYVDGVLSSQAAITGPWTPAPYEPLIICGKSNGDGTPTSMATYGEEITSAAVYDLRIYNYALGPLDIAQLQSTVTGPPTLSLSSAGGGAGSGLVLTWSRGVLLEATNVLGPWTTNATTSPYTVSPTEPQQFFRVLAP